MSTITTKRSSSRSPDQMRPVSLEVGYTRHAEGSCLVCFGSTWVLCNATVEEKLPPFLRDSRQGWVTAEYSMLPRATLTRTQRERGQVNGRTQEIQRLIGRSLRSTVSLKALGERQIIVDCDVLQADGGTRTAAITGSYVALALAVNKLYQEGKLKAMPQMTPIAAVSCGIIGGQAMLDLDYIEDAGAEVDANFVINHERKIVEIQGTAEAKAFSENELYQMLELAHAGVAQLLELQSQALDGR
ncbi:MAG: ribonuclease PH [Proteobacteria bacterium]|nr:ribonuclease PH [Pseudomonadota bacterium]